MSKWNLLPPGLSIILVLITFFYDPSWRFSTKMPVHPDRVKDAMDLMKDWGNLDVGHRNRHPWCSRLCYKGRSQKGICLSGYLRCYICWFCTRLQLLSPRFDPIRFTPRRCGPGSRYVN